MADILPVCGLVDCQMNNALDMYKTFLASGSEPVEKETQEEGRD